MECLTKKKVDVHINKLKERLTHFKAMMTRLRPTIISLKTRLELWKTF